LLRHNGVEVSPFVSPISIVLQPTFHPAQDVCQCLSGIGSLQCIGLLRNGIVVAQAVGNHEVLLRRGIVDRIKNGLIGEERPAERTTESDCEKKCVRLHVLPFANERSN
jgi:hypothetical protein